MKLPSLAKSTSWLAAALVAVFLLLSFYRLTAAITRDRVARWSAKDNSSTDTASALASRMKKRRINSNSPSGDVILR